MVIMKVFWLTRKVTWSNWWHKAVNMRTEKEMFDLILDFARQDDRIRLVAMNGSRANPNAQPDKYQDFDIFYLVTDMQPFLSDDAWLNTFGNRIIMQKPDTMQPDPAKIDSAFAYLMQLEDGNRIDLTLFPLEELETYLESDLMCVLLLDKDGLVPNLPHSTDQDYWVQKPSHKTFDDCCNEFWWLSTYVAKGLARGQIPYANAHLDLMRNELMRMLSWQAGLEQGFTFSIGKDFKYLQKHTPESEWAQLLRTWRMDSTENVWQSLFEVCDLFRRVSTKVAPGLGCPIPQYDHSVLPYLRQIQSDG